MRAKSRRSYRSRERAPAPRRRPNRRRQPKRSLFSILAGPLLVIAVIGAFAWALTDPRLEVKQVEVIGAQTVPSDEIASLVPLPSHRNLFLYWLIHHHEIRTEIERAEPAVATAQVGVRPPGTLTVSVAERQPYALLKVGQEGYWELDSHGEPFKQVSAPVELRASSGSLESAQSATLNSRDDPALNSALPCIALHDGAAPVLGQAYDMSADSPVGASYRLLHLLSTDKIATLMKIREITVDQNANLCLNMSNNLQIFLGQPNRLSQALAGAQKALASDPSLANRAAYLDFTYPERPAFKPRAALSNSDTPLPQNISD